MSFICEEDDCSLEFPDSWGEEFMFLYDLIPHGQREDYYIFVLSHAHSGVRYEKIKETEHLGLYKYTEG